jgi:hypothetical protein
VALCPILEKSPHIATSRLTLQCSIGIYITTGVTTTSHLTFLKSGRRAMPPLLDHDDHGSGGFLIF